MQLFKPFSPQQAVRHWDRYFKKVQAQAPARPLQVAIHSQKLGLDYRFPSDSADRPFHVASIGKVFTAVLVRRLAERGVLCVTDPVLRYFSRPDLDRLFVYRGVDYAEQVTLEHLLSHTSGIADYFEGRTADGRAFLDQVLSHPQVRWTPRQLIDFTRDHQAAVGVPGQVFNYSDTGYVLLGLIIERATGRSFARNLAEEIFEPLEMRDSYLMFHAEPGRAPGQAIETIWFNEVEISRFESLSCDWAGGGIISTPADLLKFSRALRGGQLIPSAALAAMDACQRRFRPGIYYGSGMMEIRFAEFFFLLGRLPRLKGHIGILATHLFYDPSRAAHIVMNFGSNTRMVASFQALIEIAAILQRLG